MRSFVLWVPAPTVRLAALSGHACMAPLERSKARVFAIKMYVEKSARV
jgi:hypothetical protein